MIPCWTFTTFVNVTLVCIDNTCQCNFINFAANSLGVQVWKHAWEIILHDNRNYKLQENNIIGCLEAAIKKNPTLGGAFKKSWQYFMLKLSKNWHCQVDLKSLLRKDIKHSILSRRGFQIHGIDETFDCLARMWFCMLHEKGHNYYINIMITQRINLHTIVLSL